MGKLIYAAITSVDGYVADAQGDFGWAEPDEEVHAFVNALERPIRTHLYGRRLYEVMLAWETMPTGPDQPAIMRDYAALWRLADKVVFSTTLRSVSSARTRLESRFDADLVRRWKSEAVADLSIGGPGLAAEAIRAGLVDEWHQFVNPVVVGGGTSWLPDDVRVDLELIDERRFASGVVHLHLRTRS
jgi:dihydrofolate reductase